MLFLADESCDGLIVRTLRAGSHDVLYVAELDPGLIDQQVLDIANEQKRIVLTEDRDFCELIFRDQVPAVGVVLVRIPARHRPRKADRIMALVTEHSAQLTGAITTLSLYAIRIRPLPTLPGQ